MMLDPRPSGEELIGNIAGGELFGDYASRYPDASLDAGQVLRAAVKVGLAEEYCTLLRTALAEDRPVPESAWHELLARVSWPRALPAWDRFPPEPIVIDGHGPIDFGKSWDWDLLDGGGSLPQRLAALLHILAAVVLVLGVVVPVSLVLRAFPARVADPLRRRLDAAAASLVASGGPPRPAAWWWRRTFQVCAIAICAALLGLALPGSATLDFWVGVAAFIVALVVVATM